MKVTHLIQISLFLFITLASFQQTEAQQGARYNAANGEYRRLPAERVYVIGKVVNIAHALQHRRGGADTQDALFSKGRQGLITSGEILWTFVDNIKGQALQWDPSFLDQYVRIHGWVFPNAHYIEVDSFSANDVDYEWNAKTNSFEPTV